MLRKGTDYEVGQFVYLTILHFLLRLVTCVRPATVKKDSHRRALRRLYRGRQSEGWPGSSKHWAIPLWIGPSGSGCLCWIASLLLLLHVYMWVSNICAGGGASAETPVWTSGICIHGQRNLISSWPWITIVKLFTFLLCLTWPGLQHFKSKMMKAWYLQTQMWTTAMTVAWKKC